MIAARTAHRLGFAALTYAAVGTQLAQQVDRGTSLLNFFSFFTILSNLLAATVFALTALGLPRDAERHDWLRGLAVMPMATTGVVWFVALRGLDESLQTTIPWVNTVVHLLMPVVVVADWLLLPPSTRLVLRRALLWLVYPVVWTAWTLLRGPVAHWYPYPFLDPAASGGAAAVAGNVLLVGLFMAVLVLAATAAGNARSGREPAPA